MATGATLVLDELLGITGSVQNEGGAANNDETNAAAAAGAIGFATLAGSSLFTTLVSDAGADGQASKVFTLVVNSAASGLTDAVTNEAITLTLDGTGTLITGSSATGGTVFTITVAADGSVTVNQFRAVEHNDSADHDENGSPESTLSGIIDLKVVLTDGDGDTATDTIDLGSLIKFEDDGPAIDIVATGATLVLDESLGITGSVQNEGGAANNDETNAAAAAGAIGFATLAGSSLFTTLVSDAGADGQASKIFTLVVNSAASGLTDAVTNEAITLTLDGTGTLITGSSATGGTVFTITVAADGSVTVNQFRAVEHNDSADHDENGSPEFMLAGDHRSEGCADRWRRRHGDRHDRPGLADQVRG